MAAATLAAEDSNPFQRSGHCPGRDMFALCCVHAGVTLAWSRTKIVALISNFSEFFTAAMLGLVTQGTPRALAMNNELCLANRSPCSRLSAVAIVMAVFCSLFFHGYEIFQYTLSIDEDAAHQAEPAPIRAEGEVGGDHFLVVKDTASCHSLDDRPRSL